METPLATVPPPPLTFLQALRYCRDPRLVRFHFQHVRKVEEMLTLVTGQPIDAVRDVMAEIWRDDSFLGELVGRHVFLTGREPRGADFMFLTGVEGFPGRIMSEKAGSPFFHGQLLYSLVRLMEPDVVVETGGTPGNSSAFMLRAMDINRTGQLHTVDLPPQDKLEDYAGDGAWYHDAMPEEGGSGWAVPDHLRERHHQHLGDAKELLPGVLEQVGPVDVFIHDSDHSEAHMTWEFETGWPHIKPGGALLSDDIRANAAWDRFIQQQGLADSKAGAFGAARKPGP
ncbi:MAG: class I SAM-dependent methyltransferase [Chloroflexi bacterium]|nr:class I SAM-dependent methyltransferase [Chloroflexota bacterium]